MPRNDYLTTYGDVQNFAAYLRAAGATVRIGSLSDVVALEGESRPGKLRVTRDQQGYVFTGITRALVVCWRRGIRTFLRPRKAQWHMVQQLITRDGNCCWFCDREFNENLPPTKEHLLAESLGGPDVIENFVLACLPCNNNAGAMSIADKVRYRDKRQKATAARRKGEARDANRATERGADLHAQYDQGGGSPSGPLDANLER